MSKETFPLIAKWLQEIKLISTGDYTAIIDAKNLEAELAKASRVTSGWHPMGDGTIGRSALWATDYFPDDKQTDEALLIGARPIKQESAEDILRDLVEDFDRSAKSRGMRVDGYTIDRARAFLARGK